jgi:hypothetical protein
VECERISVDDVKHFGRGRVRGSGAGRSCRRRCDRRERENQAPDEASGSGERR